MKDVSEVITLLRRGHKDTCQMIARWIKKDGVYLTDNGVKMECLEWERLIFNGDGEYCNRAAEWYLNEGISNDRRVEAGIFLDVINKQGGRCDT